MRKLPQHDIERVDGNSADMTDQGQYDRIRAYFSKTNCGNTVEERWTLATVQQHPEHLRRMLGVAELKPRKLEMKLLTKE
jgi:hypothetical protein